MPTNSHCASLKNPCKILIYSYFLRSFLGIANDISFLVLDLYSFFELRVSHKDAVGDAGRRHRRKGHEFLYDNASRGLKSRGALEQDAQTHGDTASRRDGTHVTGRNEHSSGRVRVLLTGHHSGQHLLTRSTYPAKKRSMGVG